ncbi:MAG TPA: GAF domain-containing protein, partial [Saliniramus sp.]|nr:GAF domain-containing protein [Saliniramus sp.]
MNINFPSTRPCPAWREEDRLAALRDYEILDTEPEEAFEEIVKIAAHVFQAPISVVNFIAEGRQWFKAEIGLGIRETPLDISICASAILQPGLFTVPDIRADRRFSSFPGVTGEPGLRFYAGALLETPEGLPLGTVCVLDHQPRPEGVSPEQASTLLALARCVMRELELKRSNKALARQT